MFHEASYAFEFLDALVWEIKRPFEDMYYKAEDIFYNLTFMIRQIQDEILKWVHVLIIFKFAYLYSYINLNFLNNILTISLILDWLY